MEKRTADVSTWLKAFSKGNREIGISELADLFGITSEALRKYESKQIIRPHRDDNGYRKYHSWELTKIIRTRQLRQEGFSLRNISETMAYGGIDRQLASMEEMQKELTREILYKKKLIRWLGTQKDELIRMEKLGDRCAIEQQPTLYCCVYMVGDTLVSKSGEQWEQLKEWMGMLPFGNVYYIGDEADEMVSCIVLSEDERLRYGLEELKADFVIPEQLCVVCSSVAEHSPGHDTSKESVADARSRAGELGISLAGYMMIRMVRYVQKGDIYRSYNKVLIPVSEEK